MALHLSEEEQIEALKRWWKENGLKTVAGIAVVALGYLGWNQYQNHVEQKAEAGSQIFDQFVAAAGDGVMPGDQQALSPQAQAQLNELSEQLTNEYGDSLYARFASLYLAKQAVEAGDYDRARTELEQALERSDNDALRQLIRLRLARVDMADGRFDAALARLEDATSPAFTDAFAELKGDIYALQKDYSQARSAYQQALDAMQDPRSMRRSLLELKLDNATLANDTIESPAGEGGEARAAEGA